MSNVNAAIEHLLEEIAGLKLDPSNPRSHDERNLKAIADSLATYGQQKPIVVASDDVVVAGNGTVQAALRLGWSSIAVVRLSVPSTHPIALGYSIADNRAQDLSTFERGPLLDRVDLLRDIVDLGVIGFQQSEIDDLRRLAPTGAVLPPEAGSAIAPDRAASASTPAGQDAAVAAAQGLHAIQVVMTTAQATEYVELVKALRALYGVETAAEAVLTALRAALNSSGPDADRAVANATRADG